MKEQVFKKYDDPGHGWLAVKRQLLIDLGIIDKITSCSYQRGKTVYLEEDLDLSTFWQAYEQKTGNAPRYIVKTQCHGNSPIRSYDCFKRYEVMR